MPAENRAEAAGPIREFMTVGTSTWTAVVGIVVVSLIVYAIQATYLHLANKLTTGAEIGFGQWFSLSVWTAFCGCVCRARRICGDLDGGLESAGRRQASGVVAEFASCACGAR